MSDTIFLENVILSMRIGCTEKERSHFQPVRVDVWMNFDAQIAGRSDKLKDTLDYVKAYDLLDELAQSQSFILLERFCELSAHALFTLGVQSVRIRASKERCPIPGFQGRVGVEIVRNKDGFD